MVQCTACDGTGGDRSEGEFLGDCGACAGEGRLELVGCPMLLAGSEAFELLQIAAAMKRGLMPEPGGWLDQTDAVLDAVNFAWSEQNRIRKTLDLMDDD